MHQPEFDSIPSVGPAAAPIVASVPPIVASVPVPAPILALARAPIPPPLQQML